MAEQDIVWSTRLDGTYRVEVVRLRPYEGELRVYAGLPSDSEVLLREAVTLGFNAIFGPDVADLNAWQNRAAEFVDSLGRQ